VNAISGLALQLKSPCSLIGHTTLLDKQNVCCRSIADCVENIYALKFIYFKVLKATKVTGILI